MNERRSLFGVETEYAITAMKSGTAVEREVVLHAMMAAARQRLVHLPDLTSGGIFLENGSRFYVDCGQHPEMSTPECPDPWSLVRYVQAGHRIMIDLARAAESSCATGTQVMCFRCNVDYGGTSSTWGSHESYLHRINPVDLQPQIIPHIVSRLVYSSAGGFNPISPGLEFTLSPRVAYINRVVSSDSTSDRGIFHTKNEPLSQDGYNRLHILCGESLCSETALFLKVGTTALIVAMAGGGANPGSDVQIESPLEALRTFASDSTCKKSVRMKGGRRLTAIEIQRHYLEKAEADLNADYMPAWAGEVCRVWRRILDLLATDPQSTDRTLDWSLKLSLYADQARRLGIRWDRLSFWNEVVTRLNTALQGANYNETPVTLDFVLGPESPISCEVARLTNLFRSKGTDWKELTRVLDARQRFFEIDTRFGQLGPNGIFESLDSAGVLSHKLDGAENSDRAVSEPPSTGRARIRGNAIRRLAAEPGAWRCDWQYIISADGRTLDLSNPFATQETWRTSPEPELSIRPDRLSILSYLDNLRRRV